MIFSSSTIFGSMITEKLINSCSGATCRVLVYQGAQPSISSYIADWDSKYKYPGQHLSSLSAGNNGTELLAVYGGDGPNNCFGSGGGSWDSGAVPVKLTNGASAVTLDSTNSIPTKFYVRDGTAAWAAVFFADSFTFDSYCSGPFSVDDFKNTAYMIVPISDTSGNGVVRLGSTTITESLTDIGDIYLSFSIPGAV